MKLLIYSHYFTPSVGGVETIVTLLARKLCEVRVAQRNNAKFEVTVVTQTPATGFDDRTFAFRVVRAPSLFQTWRLIRWADVVHVAGPSVAPMLLAKLAGKPYVVEHHGYQAICLNGVLIHQPDRSVCPGHFRAGNYATCVRCQRQEMSLPKAIARLLLMFPRHSLSRAANGNVAITHHSLERHRLPRAQVIYYGIETTQENTISQETNDSNNQLTRFAYVGRLVPEKGLDVLLRAAELLKNDRCRFEVLLIGEGSERVKLEALIETNNLKDVARITGFLRGADLASQMSRVHAVVMPSVWEETAGLAAIEQMMRGRIVIGSDIGGLGEIVDGAGLKSPAGDAQRLADQMKTVIQGGPQVSELGKTAQHRARSMFSADRMVDEHVSAYLKMG